MWFLHDEIGLALCCLAHGELAWLVNEPHTKAEVFVEKEVRGRAWTGRGNTRGGPTKKREISCSLFPINLHFLVQGWTTTLVL